MKKNKYLLLLFVSLLLLTGCVDTESTNEKGEKTRTFNVSETAKVNNTIFKINSIKKIEKECMFEFDGKCSSWNEPENDFFLVIDLTIENNGEEDLAISSMISFDLKDIDGVKGNYAILTESVKSQLDGTVMPGDKLSGQIGYDVKNSNEYNFYFIDSLLDSPIKFIFNQTDIE